MPEISKDHPELAIFLTIEKMEDPVAYFWNLVISLKGEEPQTNSTAKSFSVERNN
jgi:hypothetical protein